MAANNAYTGPTTILAGTLRAYWQNGSGHAFGTNSAVPLANTNAFAITLPAGGTYTLPTTTGTGKSAASAALTVTSAATLTPVDAGSYTISAEAPGYLPWQVEVQVDPQSKHRVVTVPALVVAPAATSSRLAEPIGLRTTHHEPSVWTNTRKVSLVLGVLGAGAAGTGVYLGVHAKDLQDQADRRCPLSDCNDPAAVRDFKQRDRNINQCGLPSGSIASRSAERIGSNVWPRLLQHVMANCGLDKHRRWSSHV